MCCREADLKPGQARVGLVHRRARERERHASWQQLAAGDVAPRRQQRRDRALFDEADEFARNQSRSYRHAKAGVVALQLEGDEGVEEIAVVPQQTGRIRESRGAGHGESQGAKRREAVAGTDFEPQATDITEQRDQILDRVMLGILGNHAAGVGKIAFDQAGA